MPGLGWRCGESRAARRCSTRERRCSKRAASTHLGRGRLAPRGRAAAVGQRRGRHALACLVGRSWGKAEEGREEQEIREWLRVRRRALLPCLARPHTPPASLPCRASVMITTPRQANQSGLCEGAGAEGSSSSAQAGAHRSSACDPSWLGFLRGLLKESKGCARGTRTKRVATSKGKRVIGGASGGVCRSWSLLPQQRRLLCSHNTPECFSRCSLSSERRGFANKRRKRSFGICRIHPSDTSPTAPLTEIVIRSTTASSVTSSSSGLSSSFNRAPHSHHGVAAAQPGQAAKGGWCGHHEM